MKKIILLFVMTLAGIAFSQSTGVVEGNGVIWTDSLGYTKYAETKDSVWILKTNFLYNDYRIFIKGNANTTVDSLRCYSGTIRYRENKTPVDTIWGSQIALKDSAGNTVYTIINNTVGKDYTMTRPATQLFKIALLNYRAAKPLRNTVLTINAGK